jgi:hypothetical protein
VARQRAQENVGADPSGVPKQLSARRDAISLPLPQVQAERPAHSQAMSERRRAADQRYPKVLHLVSNPSQETAFTTEDTEVTENRRNIHSFTHDPGVHHNAFPHFTLLADCSSLLFSSWASLFFAVLCRLNVFSVSVISVSSVVNAFVV